MGARLFAITDAVTETGRGAYQHKLNNGYYSHGKILSGSALTMHGAFLILMKQAAIAPEMALRMCGTTAARLIGCGMHWGRIGAGSAACFPVLNNEREIECLLSEPGSGAPSLVAAPYVVGRIV